MVYLGPEELIILSSVTLFMPLFSLTTSNAQDFEIQKPGRDSSLRCFQLASFFPKSSECLALA